MKRAMHALKPQLLSAWCVNLLSVVSDAYNLGRVLIESSLNHSTQVLLRDPNHKIFATKLSITVFDSSNWQGRAQNLLHAQTAGEHEVWHLKASTGRCELYQRSADGPLVRVPPDKNGIYYSTIAEELSFPVIWFAERPSLWNMMSYWGMIDVE